ncbi:MAG: FAD-binding protein [Oscillospiraceae bacterium]|nr:FAD-binding protein [Oscillospiraceae bacterium]
MKRSRIVAIALVLTMVLGTVAMAASGKTVTIFPGVNITVNGDKVTPVDANGNAVETFIYNDTTYLPLRYLAELLGWNVNWDGDSNTAQLSTDQPVTIPGTTAKDGTYTGTGTGKNGSVKVEVTFANGAITAVNVVEHQETEGICEPAIERIPKAIVDNQSVAIDAVSGASLTSGAILNAVKDCIGQAGGSVAAFEKKAEATEGKTVEYDADIVIVGAGGAGLLAAYTASQGGAKVIVLEKAANALSSNFSRCGGPAGAETVVAKEQGVTTTNKEVFDHLYDYANTTVDAKLLWEVWCRAGVAIDDMVDLGITFRDVNEDTYGVGYLARHSFAVRGADRVNPLINAVEAKGGQFLYETPGEKILMENGKAVGVQGTNSNGDTVIVHAKAVMTCTGGFQGNEEMLHEHFGDVNVISLGSTTPSGDGINMVLEAGGTLDRNFGVLGDEFKGNNTKATNANNANLTFWLYGGLYVDRDGDRFINEKLVADFPLALGGEAILRQGKVYAVMSEEYYKACTTEGEGIINYLGNPDDWASKVGLRAQNGLTNAPEQLQQAIDDGWAIKADTLAEAAEYFGLENLEQTVAEYNEACANGVDPIYGKSANFLKAIGEGPYYVFEYEPAAWSTFGGVKTDSYLRAVGANGDVIPGLYCGGCEVGSYYAVPYFDGPGSCVGIAVGSGVYAGENMLEYIGLGK